MTWFTLTEIIPRFWWFGNRDNMRNLKSFVCEKNTPWEFDFIYTVFINTPIPKFLTMPLRGSNAIIYILSLHSE